MCNRCEWEDHLETLSGLVDDPDYEWASILPSIKEWVEENEHITPRQKQAVRNVTRAGNEGGKG